MENNGTSKLDGATKNTVKNDTSLTHAPSAEAESQKEGKVARAIETQTAKLPSDLFLWAAGAALIGSAAFQVIGMRRGKRDAASETRAPMASFIGLWVPSLLMLGVYNKIVKVAGSDRVTR